MQGLSAGRRRLLHERLALRLERADAQAALVAAHWEAAQQPARAIRWRVAAAESALRVHALDAALASYAQALADGAQGAIAATVQQGCARVHMRRADHAAADEAFAEAMTAAASDAAAGPDEVLRLQLEQAEYWCTTDRVEAALAVLEALAPELSKATPALRAKALAVARRGPGPTRPLQHRGSADERGGSLARGRARVALAARGAAAEPGTLEPVAWRRRRLGPARSARRRRVRVDRRRGRAGQVARPARPVPQGARRARRGGCARRTCARAGRALRRRAGAARRDLQPGAHLHRPRRHRNGSPRCSTRAKRSARCSRAA